ncbi:hypothetical protein E6H18_04920 [Candidatus Bathyarchaeota archaeon]|nr:MAG: hypothetical protein E6H18_04920 [Candidatus Bathyarchaeota archaeon]
MQVNQSASSDEKHSHQLSRANLQVCNTCGSFFVTRYKETEKGELVLEELELEVKVTSSRIGQFSSTVRQVNGAPKESSDIDKTREETCW